MKNRDMHTVCFTLEAALADKLDILALKDDRKLSVYIREKIIKPYLEESNK